MNLFVLGVAFADEVRRLEPRMDERVCREISAGETHSYEIDLAAGHYLRAAVYQQRGACAFEDHADTIVTVTAPGGRLVQRSDGPAGRTLWELVSLVTGEGGEHVLTVEAAGEEGGGYELHVEELRPAGPGDAHRVVAERLYTEALHRKSLAAKDEKDRAVKLFERAAASFGRAGEAVEQGRCFNQVGITHRQLLRYDEALEAYGRALELWRGAGDLAGEANVLGNMGVVHRDRGDASRALEHFRAALDLQERLAGGRVSRALVTTLRNVAQARYDLGRFEDALADYRRALEGSRALASDPAGEVFALNGLGRCRLTLGELPTARDAFETALGLSREAGLRYPEAVSSSNLGTWFRRQGDLDSALAGYEHALDLFQALGMPHNVAEVRQNLGTVYDELGQPERALEEFAAAGETWRAAGNERLAALAALSRAWVRIAGGEAGETLGELRGLLTERRAAGDLDTAAEVLHALGFAFLSEGRPDRARDALVLARERWQATGRRAARARTSSLLGRALHELGDAEAEAVLRDALSWGRRLAHPVATALALRGLAEIERDRGALDAAREHLDEALRIVESQRGQVPTPELRATFLARRRSLYTSYVDLLIELHERRPGAGFDAAAFEASERSRARALLDLLHERDPRFGDLRLGEPIDLRRARELLDEGTALVEYVLGEGGALAFVVTRDAVRSFELPAPAAEIAARVGQVRAGLAAGGRRRRGLFRSASRRLYELLVAPLEGSLQARERLLVVPDRSLHLLPFEALLMTAPASSPDGAGDTYLLERWSVAYIPSAGVLDVLARPVRRDGGAPPELVAFADPDFGGGGRWRELPASAREARRIAGLYPAERVGLFLGAEATEELVKTSDLVARARRLHFATHGSIDEDRPRDSALVLAPDPASREDGFLRVHEIFGLRLDAELVVLSACETGLGREIAGEGLIGLTRGFLYAGARRVAVSLWRVDDEVTAVLMTRFYEELEGPGTAEALRRAKLALLREGTFAHPSHWASFVLVGLP